MKRMIQLIALVSALLFSTFAFSKQTVEIVWWAGVASGPANYARDIIEEANRQQDKYQFVMTMKPGAAGAIASQYALRSKTPAIVGTGDAFFVRPILFADTAGYTVNDFKLILPQVSLPYAVVMRKGRNVEEMLKQSQVTIGIGGLGTTQHLIAEQLKKQIPNLTLVPYTQHTEATKDVLGGQLDLSTDFLVAVDANPDLEVFGITGKRNVGKHRTLASRGVKGLETGNVHIFMVAPAAMDDSMFKELQSILAKAQDTSDRLKVRYKEDNTERIDVPLTKYSDWLNELNQDFINRTRGIKIQ